jgi:hypothetical protein
MEKKKEMLEELKKLDKKDYVKFMNQAAFAYKSKFKTQLILENEDNSTLIDGSSYQHYFDSLTLIENWIQECIDEIRIYLKPICYPLFIHLYLRLINNNYPEQAEQFLKQNREKYKAFDDEINKFSLAKKPLNENNPLIYKYLQSKTHIFIPNETFNFFLHFLNTSHLTLVLGILKKYFERSNILSKLSQSDDEKNKFLLLNNSSADIENINCKTQIYYNKVNKDIIDNLSRGKSKGRGYDSVLSKIIIPFPETANEFINVDLPELGIPAIIALKGLASIPFLRSLSIFS